ncbi:hypothetical protein BGX24_003885, partial [Mortierella sp. AD032]
KHTCKTQLGTDEIQNNLKEKALEGGGILRLRLHRQIEVPMEEEYLHLTIGAKIRSSLEHTTPPQSFTLHYVELGTNCFQPSSPDQLYDHRDDYILYGEGRPHQMIAVDRDIQGSENAGATKIRTYGISDKAEFAVTLHLREVPKPNNPTLPGITRETTINMEPTAGLAAGLGLAATIVAAAANITLQSRTRVQGVISVWDLRSHNVGTDEDVRALPAWKTLPYLDPNAKINIDLPDNLNTPEAWDNFRASISISTHGSKVVLGGIETTYGALPFTVYDCKYAGRVDKIGASRTIEVATKQGCKELKEFSGYGLFHRVDPTKFDHSDENDNERFITFNGSVLEVYSTRSLGCSGWIQLQQIILSPSRGLHRANCYAIVQSLRGRYFAWTGDHGVVSIWDMEKGKPLSNIFVDLDKSPIYAVLSPDGTKVAISVNRTVQIHESSTGILLGVHTKGVMSDNNSEVVLGNEYFVVRDNSQSPHEPAKVRSVVRIKDMEVVEAASTSLHDDYHITYPLASMTTIAAYKQGSVLNIKRLTKIETPRVQHPCGDTPCEPNEVPIDDFINKKPFTYISGTREVFYAKCRQEYHNGCWNMMLEITVGGGPHNLSTGSPPPTKSMVLPLGDTSASFHGFYLPEPSKLVIFAEGYMKIWKLSSTAAHICQLDYIWGSLSYEPERSADYCHRPLIKAWACRHGTSMKFHLGKRVWYKNHIVVDGDPKSNLYDVLTVPPQQKGETVMTTEAERLEYGIFSLIDIYGYGDPSCKEDIVRYLLTCIRPSTVNKTSCLVPLCNAWSTQNQVYLTRLVSEILPKKDITWIPDSKATTTTEPLAILLNKPSGQQSMIGLVRVLMGYCVTQATQHKNAAFLFPIFASMHKVMDHYPEEALKCMGRIAYIPIKHPTYIWKNHVACTKMALVRFPIIDKLRFIVMSATKIKRMKQMNSIMQFKYKMDKTVADSEENTEKPVFMASFDALWFYTGKESMDKKNQANEGGGKGTGKGAVDGREKGGEDKSREKIEGKRKRRWGLKTEGAKKNGGGGAAGGEGAGTQGKRSDQLTPPNSFKSDIFGEPVEDKKTTWWKVLGYMFLTRLLFQVRPVVECYDFDLEFFDNPAIDALVTYKWDTIGFPYWFVRFFCQLFYYVLVVTAAITQVYNVQPSRLYGVFIAIIAMGIMFVILEILQLLQNWKRYLASHYNFVDIVTFVVPPIASAMQIHFIHKEASSANNRVLSFSVLIVFFHMLLELRISRGVCKYVTIIQQAVVEIWVFFGIFAGCIIAFTITLLHLLRSCAYEGCENNGTEYNVTKYPRNFFSALSATYFFLGGRFDPVEKEMDASVNEDWAFRLAMFIFLFSTTILMLNVLIALINVAFGKGDDGWRKAWIESRLRYIESAENLSYHIPGFRQTYDWFPKQIYFTATAKEVNRYIEKYPKGRRQDDINALVDDWVKFEGDDDDKDDGKSNNVDTDNEERPSSLTSRSAPIQEPPPYPPYPNSQDNDCSSDPRILSPYGSLIRSTNQQNTGMPLQAIFESGDERERGRNGDTQHLGNDSGDDFPDMQQTVASIKSQLNTYSAPGSSSRPGSALVKEQSKGLLSGDIDLAALMSILRKLDSKMDSIVQKVKLNEEQIEALSTHLELPFPPRPSLSDNFAPRDLSSSP